MKRFTLTIVLLTMAVLSGAAHAQKWYFYESFDNIAVDATGSGYVPDAFTLYNDNNEPFNGKPDLSYFDMAWKVMRGMDGEGYVASPSLFMEQNAQADRWLVTPAISLEGAVAPKLYFRAKAGDSLVRDGFVLKISTTSAEASAFKNIRSVREARGTWTDYVFDLSEYAGKTVYLAFVQNSTNMLTIAIDDIRVGETANGVAAACNNAYTPLYMIHTHKGSNMPFTVSATLQNWSNTPITSARLCVRMDDGATVTRMLKNLQIGAAGETSLYKQSFSLKFVPEKANKNAVVEIWFDQLNGQDSISTDHSTVNCFVAEETDLTYKKTIFEIFSSSMCPSCAPWNRTFHIWDSLYGGDDINRPDGFVVAKFQVNIPAAGDPLVTSETLSRCNFYSIQGAPTWMLNGRTFTLYGGSEENIELTLQNFLDSMAAFQRTPSPIALQARLQIDGQTLKPEVRTTSKLPIQGKYRLYVALAEDSIHMLSSHNGETEFYNVVRKMFPNANGMALNTPQPTDDNTEANFAYTYTVGENPQFYGSLDRVGVIAYIQNTETKEIIQAVYASANGEWAQASAWVNDGVYNATNEDFTANEARREAAADVVLYPNPVGETATLSFRPLNGNRITVSIINMQGRVLSRQTVAGGTERQMLTLPTANLTEGLYVVCIESADGRTSVKLLKK